MIINFLITQGEFLTTFCEFMNFILHFENNYFRRVDLFNSFFDIGITTKIRIHLE